MPSSLFLELRLPPNALERAWMQIIVRMACYRYRAYLDWMLQLPVAATHTHHHPAVFV
jgi:hypothetical protein